MPRTDRAKVVGIERAGETLRFTGALLRAQAADAWRRALPQLDGVRAFDLSAVERVDSAGVALLAELAARAGENITISGDPSGLAELRGAYRLTPMLTFAA